MVTGILLALLAGCGFAAGAALFAQVVRRGLPFLGFLGLGAGIGCLAGLAMVVDWRALADAPRSGELALWIIPGANANVAGHWAIARALAGGSAPVAWAIGQGGQAVPFLVAALLYRDPTHPLAWLGLATVLAGVALLARSRVAPNGAASGGRAWVGWALLALACYGLNGSLMAVPSRWTCWSDAAHLRMPLTLAVFAFGGLLLTRGWDRALVRGLLPWALPYAGVLMGVFWCLYLALDRLTAAGAASVAWPLACGSGIAAFALWERLALRRPSTWPAWAGIALVIAGIAGLAIRPA
ncbi:MAG: hypothetical protein HY822_13820 [Acidobacteria bacterium]|nr:hypothetical protein [Acidobacteriota bacterium]